MARPHSAASERRAVPIVFVIVALAVGAVVPLLPARASAQTTPLGGRWSISRADAAETTRVLLRLESDAPRPVSWSAVVPPTDLGITADRLQGPAGQVAFSLRRDPGVLTCSGRIGDRAADGRFVYAPDHGFDDALAARGLSRPTERESFELAAAGATLAFVDAARASAPHASLAEILHFVRHGVTPAFIADLDSLGYRIDSFEELLRFRDHGVTPGFIRTAQNAGYGSLTARELLRLADDGITERYITAMRDAGLTVRSASLVLRLHDHGVTPRYVASLAAAGYRGLAPEDFIELRDNGVDRAFVDRLRSRGYTNLSVRDLVRLRSTAL
jgi:hypothetical protein